MNNWKILIIEDELHIAHLLKMNMEMEGHEVYMTHNIHDANIAFLNQNIDLVILDIMLPDGNGIELCQQFKKLKPLTPVLILSALGQSDDRVRGLRAGADDYLPKPFNLEELLLRVSILLKRVATESNIITKEIRIGDAIFDEFQLTLTTDHLKYQLSVKEAELLRLLLSHLGKPLTRLQIISVLWGDDSNHSTRTIDNFVAQLRKIIEPNPRSPRYLKTVRGLGYMLSSEDK